MKDLIRKARQVLNAPETSAFWRPSESDVLALRLSSDTGPTPASREQVLDILNLLDNELRDSDQQEELLTEFRSVEEVAHRTFLIKVVSDEILLFTYLVVG